MDYWLDQLEHSLLHDDAVVLVSVLRVQGSVPRRPGATMCITASNQSGTIGGGHLEFQATAIARDMLRRQLVAPVRKVYPLGPAIGQCCGGRVELLFEYINAENSPIDLTPVNALRRAISNTRHTRFEAATLPPCAENLDSNAVVLTEKDEREYLIVQADLQLPEVWLFGAGHVGQAVVRQLSLLPCRVKWLDDREEIFPSHRPPSVTVCCCDSIVDELAHAPVNVSFVVMTHNHALDFEICHLALQQPFTYLGLIGSETKAARFKNKLRLRGISDEQVARLACPLGSGDISSNEPYAIAISLALQLMAYWR